MASSRPCTYDLCSLHSYELSLFLVWFSPAQDVVFKPQKSASAPVMVAAPKIQAKPDVPPPDPVQVPAKKPEVQYVYKQSPLWHYGYYS